MTPLARSPVRRSRLFASDIRQLGGVVSVHPSRDRYGGDPGSGWAMTLPAALEIRREILAAMKKVKPR